MADGDGRSRLARWRGLFGLAGRRVAARATGQGSRQLWLTVAGVALPVALLLVVTSVSTGLATGATVTNPDVDYWIVPESGDAASAVVSVGGPQLGRVHATSTRLSERDGIDHATPVLRSMVQVRAASGREEFVIAVGVVPRATPDRFAGVSTAGLSPGDPYFADGRYDGAHTGEAVLSAGAAELLGASAGSTLGVGAASAGRNRSFTVVNVSEGGATAGGTLPVMVVHLSELQAVTGADAGDRADQLLVSTTEPGVREALEGVYPESLVLTRSGLATQRLFDAALPRALSLTALAVALVVGVLFAGSTLGLAVAAEGRHRALLSALGVSGRSRAAVLAVEVTIVALVGGVAGAALGAAGAAAINLVALRTLTTLPVAVFRPVFVGYGLAVALAIGLATVPYLLAVGRRTTAVEDLTA